MLKIHPLLPSFWFKRKKSKITRKKGRNLLEIKTRGKKKEFKKIHHAHIFIVNVIINSSSSSAEFPSIAAFDPPSPFFFPDQLRRDVIFKSPIPLSSSTFESSITTSLASKQALTDLTKEIIHNHQIFRSFSIKASLCRFQMWYQFEFLQKHEPQVLSQSRKEDRDAGSSSGPLNPLRVQI